MTDYDTLCRMPKDQLVSIVEMLEHRIAEITPEPGPPELDGLDLHLTNAERGIVGALLHFRGRALTRDNLLAASQRDNHVDEWPEVKIIDAQVCRLRAKLKTAGASFTIRTVWGCGYVIDKEPGSN